MGNASQSNVVSANNKVIGGLQKYMPKKTFVIAGKVWSTQDLVQTFTDENGEIAASTNAKAEWVKAAASVKANRAPNEALRAAIHQTVLVQFGADPTVLDAFGYAKPRKATPASPETKIVAAAKRVATRKARGTLGSKQRKALNRALTTPQAFTVSVTPTVTATAAPATSAPAVSAPAVSPNGTTTQK
jgi:hypothetical protein